MLASTSPPLLNETVSWLAQRPVTVRCLSPTEAAEDYHLSVLGWLAYVDGRYVNDRFIPGNVATLTPKVCWPLLAIGRRYSSVYTTSEVALALLVLTHESGHLRGRGWSEAQTQCWAIRHVGYVARRLGVSASELPAVLAAALEWDARLPDSYRLPGCVRPRVD